MKSLSVTIQMKATEHFFPVVLFILLCKVVLCSDGLWMKSLSVRPLKRKLLSNASHPLVPFVMLYKYKVVINFVCR